MGKQQKHQVTLTQEEREYLIKNTTTGSWSPREVKRAQVLLRADKNKGGKQDTQIAEELNCSRESVVNLRQRFSKERLKIIQDKTRSGRPKIIDGQAEAHIIAVACSQPPEGRERWTLRLIAGKIVELADIESCSHASVRTVLKKMNSSRGKKKSGKYPPRPMPTLYGEWKRC